jgi:hypothetical protein
MYNFKIDVGETNEETILLLGVSRSFSIIQKLFCSKHIRATFIYNLIDVHAEHILTPSDNRTRGNAAYRTLYTIADVYRYSFFPRTIITWNTIPPTLRQVK